ncbi:MAG TPA: hypothetical protein VK158_02340 [Acidobacteriota bacterium]|nr:hypothetical protein [Acidobacteriota bacterium]
MERNVQIAGFTTVDAHTKSVVDSVVERFVIKSKHKLGIAPELKIVHKAIHKTPLNAVHNIKINLLVGGKVYHAESENREVLTALDDAITSVETRLAHAH